MRGGAWRKEGGGNHEGPSQSRWALGRGAEGARLLDEQRAARVAVARALAAFEISDGADHRVGECKTGYIVPVSFALGVGEQLEVDRMQHVWRRAAKGRVPPPRHGGSRVGTAVAAVVEIGLGDGVGAADRLRQEAQTPTCERGEGESGGGRGRGESKGRRRLFATGRVRGRMHLRQAEERDVVSRNVALVIGVLELLVDTQSLGALVLARPTVESVAVYVYHHF